MGRRERSKKRIEVEQYFYNMICRILVVMMIWNNTSQKMKCDISELNYDFSYIRLLGA